MGKAARHGAAMTESVGFFDAAPMQIDRTKGWDYFRERGDVYEADGSGI